VYIRQSLYFIVHCITYYYYVLAVHLPAHTVQGMEYSCVHTVHVSRYANLLWEITVWLGRPTMSRNDDFPFCSCALIDWSQLYNLWPIFLPLYVMHHSGENCNFSLFFCFLYAYLYYSRCPDWSIDASKTYGMLLVSAQSRDCTRPIISAHLFILFCDPFLYLTKSCW